MLCKGAKKCFKKKKTHELIGGRADRRASNMAYKRRQQDNGIRTRSTEAASRKKTKAILRKQACY